MNEVVFDPNHVVGDIPEKNEPTVALNPPHAEPRAEGLFAED
jgi:hypothetical protein